MLVIMKVKKFGHCCLLIEEKGIKILTDPGAYTDLDVVVKEARDVDVILITHEHADHVHVPSLKKLVENNMNARVITNVSVGKLLDAENIKYEVLEDGQSKEVGGVIIEALDGQHEEIYGRFGDVQNTGFFIGDKLFYPGDSFHLPGRGVDVLALPVAGPWCRIADAVNYALKIKPKKAFPVPIDIKTPPLKFLSNKPPSRIMLKSLFN